MLSLVSDTSCLSERIVRLIAIVSLLKVVLFSLSEVSKHGELYSLDDVCRALRWFIRALYIAVQHAAARYH